MPFARLPDVSNLIPVNWNIKFLTHASAIIDNLDVAHGPPFIRLIEIFQDGFVDGATITCLDTIPPKRVADEPISLLDYIRENAPIMEDIRQKEVLLYDRRNSTSYMILPMKGVPATESHFVFILWRNDRIFSPDDVVTARIIVQLVAAKFKTFRSGRAAGATDSLPAGILDAPPALQSAALDAIPDIVIMCSAEGHILGLNRAGQVTLQKFLTKILSFAGRAWLSEACHPDEVQELLASWEEAQKDQMIKSVQCRLKVSPLYVVAGRLGQVNFNVYRRFQWRIVPLKIQAEPMCVMIASDLENNEGDESTKSTAMMKSRFLAEISHEIRTPLACVLGTATLLSHSKLEKDQLELVQTITLSSQQLSNLISNVLDLNRIEENKLFLENIPVEIERCAHEVSDLFRTDLTRNKLDLIIKIDPQVPQWFRADELRLRQVLTNLISNAIKFSKPRGLIQFIVNPHLSEPHMMEFLIQDEGIGISEATAANLFQSFSQAEASTARRFGGSGLGLVISKKLVELMGGKIVFESVLGKGTSFHFTIKYEPCEPMQSENAKDCGEYKSMVQGSTELKALLAETNLNLFLSLQLSNPKLNSFLQESFLSCNVPAIFPMELPSRVGDDEFLIQVTDSLPTAENFVECAKKNVRLGILFLEYEFPEHIQAGSFFEKIKKPIKFCKVIEGVVSLITRRYRSGLRAAGIPRSVEAATSGPQPQLKILVAEDDLMNQEIIRKTLLKMGFTDTTIVNDGMEAIEEIARAEELGIPYDLVLMDMLMPKLDGCSAARLIRGRGFTTHVVAMTANAFLEDREACLSAGMCEYASKPVKWEVLANILGNAHEIKSGLSQCRCSSAKLA